MKCSRGWLAGLAVGLGVGVLGWTLWRWRRRRHEPRRIEAVAPSPEAAIRQAAPSGLRPPNIVLVDDRAQLTHERPDDLTRIEGIGPKVQRLLKDAGIGTYNQLADASLERLRQVLLAARLPMIDPTTWLEQAALAAIGDAEALARLQATLKAGRRIT